jgi:predicted HTH domain antitoxin
MTRLDVPVPDELVQFLGSEEAAREHLRRTAVLDLVKRQVISQGRGAELLGMSLWDFRGLMADADVPVISLAEGELDEGHQSLKRALNAEAE